MGNKERYEKFMQGKKKIGFRVSEATFEAFNKKLEEDSITQQYMLETAINRYIEGIDYYKK